nr:glycosyltransferase [Luteolibacter marinus]
MASLDPATGGPARSVPQLALAQSGLGHEVGLWAPGMDHGAGTWRVADLASDAVERMQLLPGEFEQALDSFGRPDLVHDHGIWLPCHRQVAKACAARGIPRIASPRGMLEPWALNHKKWKKRAAWWLYQKRDLQAAAGLHATADSEARQLRRLGLKAPMVVAANGVTVPILESGFLTRFDSQEAGCEAGGLPNGFGFEEAGCKPALHRTALFLSRIHPKKGLPMLVEAWARVRPEGWSMRVVGPDEGGHRGEVERLVAGAGLTDCWSFANSLEGDDKWRAMAAADLFVLPTHSENFGIVVAESLACGVPVITTTAAPWQGLRDHGCGWWVEPDAAALGAALDEATRVEASGLREMGRSGREWMAADFGWEGIARKMEAFYQEVAG